MATRRSLIQSLTHDLCPFTGYTGTQALIKTKSEHKYCKQDIRDLKQQLGHLPKERYTGVKYHKSMIYEVFIWEDF